MIDLIHGDCVDLVKCIPEINVTVTSPPYNKRGAGGGIFRKIEYDTFDDTLPEEEYQLSLIHI